MQNQNQRHYSAPLNYSQPPRFTDISRQELQRKDWKMFHKSNWNVPAAPLLPQQPLNPQNAKLVGPNAVTSPTLRRQAVEEPLPWPQCWRHTPPLAFSSCTGRPMYFGCDTRQVRSEEVAPADNGIAIYRFFCHRLDAFCVLTSSSWGVCTVYNVVCHELVIIGKKINWCVPDVLGALAVWRLNKASTNKNKNCECLRARRFRADLLLHLHLCAFLQ